MNDREMGLQAFTSLKEVYKLASGLDDKAGDVIEDRNNCYDLLNEILGEVEQHFDPLNNWRPVE